MGFLPTLSLNLAQGISLNLYVTCYRNKCFNEKKRRELENETINQLEELLGSCLAEVKQPDKNGIVREATRQIQDVLQRLRDCPEECPVRVPQCTSPVQAGEISSTQPPPDSHYSELTNLIEVWLVKDQRVCFFFVDFLINLSLTLFEDGKYFTGY